MFSYNVILALKSMRRNPIITALMVAAIAVGIGVSMTTMTVYYLMSSNPIPHKSDVLYAVTMTEDDDSGSPEFRERVAEARAHLDKMLRILREESGEDGETPSSLDNEVDRAEIKHWIANRVAAAVSPDAVSSWVVASKSATLDAILDELRGLREDLQSRDDREEGWLAANTPAEEGEGEA